MSFIWKYHSRHWVKENANHCDNKEFQLYPFNISVFYI